MSFLHEMDERLRALERSKDPMDRERLEHERSRTGKVEYYRKCTLCNDWSSHPLIVYPVGENDNGETAPIGAVKVQGHWVELCYRELEKFGMGIAPGLLEYAEEIFANPTRI